MCSTNDPPRDHTIPLDGTPPARVSSDSRRFHRPPTSAGTISRGVLWKLGSQFTVQLFALVVSLAVARLLVPSEYGTASLALALAAFGLIFSDLTLGAVLVQRPIIGQIEASSLMWFSLGVGLVLTLSFALLTPQLAALLRSPGLEKLLLGIAPVFAISTAGTVPTALLNRRMEFRKLELRMVVATVISSSCALLVAFLGGGAWALVSQQLVQVSLLTLLAWGSARWLPSFAVSRTQLRVLAPSALYVAGNRAVSTLGANLDNVLVGRYLGAAALGIYGIAYNVLLIPLARLSVPIQEVVFPTLSSLQDRAAVGRLWLRANVALCAALAPVMIALSVEADDFVQVVLGPRWAKVGPVLRILAVGGLLQLSLRLGSSALQACGRQRLLFATSSVTAGLLVIGFIFGLHWGTVGVATGFTLAYVLAVPLQLASAMRVMTVRPSEFGRAMTPLAVACAAMAAVMVCFRLSVPVQPLGRLIFATALGLGVFIVVLLVKAPGLVADLKMLVTSIRDKQRA